MRKLLLIIPLLFGFCLLSAESMSGQQAQDGEGSLLPDIDPQDIEIRSQFRARFPGLRRQPILGFTPGSRVFQVDPDRIPFLEDPENIAAQIPVGELDRPEEPEQRLFPYADDRIAFGRLGLGNNTSIESEFYANAEARENHWFTASMRHNSTNGHLDHKSSFRYFDVESSYRGKIGQRTIAGVTAGVQTDFNYMPELDVDLSDVESSAESFRLNTGRKDYTNFHGGVRIQHYQNAIEHLDIGFNSYFSSIRLDDDSFGFTSDLSDWGVSLDGSYTWAGASINETYGLFGDIQAGGFEIEPADGNQTWFMVGGGAYYQRLFNYNTLLRASLGAYLVEDAAENSTFYLAPDILAEHYISSRITISGSLKGKPSHAGHMQYHANNRFLLPENQLVHQYNLTAKGQLTVEPISNNKIRGGFTFQTGKNYPVYQRSPDLDPDLTPGENFRGHYTLGFEDVYIPGFFAGINVDLIPERLWFDAEAYARNPRISSDQKIPFEESYGLNGSITVRPFQRLLIEGWGEFIGSRETFDEIKLDPFLQLGTRLELRLANRVGAYGKIVNLLNQDYEIWEGYNERPFQVYAGITINL